MAGRCSGAASHASAGQSTKAPPLRAYLQRIINSGSTGNTKQVVAWAEVTPSQQRAPQSCMRWPACTVCSTHLSIDVRRVLFEEGGHVPEPQQHVLLDLHSRQGM